MKIGSNRYHTMIKAGFLFCWKCGKPVAPLDFSKLNGGHLGCKSTLIEMDLARVSGFIEVIEEDV